MRSTAELKLNEMNHCCHEKTKTKLLQLYTVIQSLLPCRLQQSTTRGGGEAPNVTRVGRSRDGGGCWVWTAPALA